MVHTLTDCKTDCIWRKGCIGIGFNKSSNLCIVSLYHKDEDESHDYGNEDNHYQQYTLEGVVRK